jgi:Fuc2NAc and GlcNAc transferase
VSLLPLIALAGGLSALFTALYLRWAARIAAIDRPGPRSSHQEPRPTGGGAALLLAVLVALALYEPQRIASAHYALVVVAALLGAVGAIDDRRALPVGLRLMTQFLAVAALLWLVDAPGAMPAALLPVLLVALVWWVNAFNFMDGIDGLATVQALFVAVATLSLLPGDSAAVPGLVAVAAVAAGFLPFNWPPARLFMGDTGSLFLGLVLAGLAALAWRAGDLSPWAWLILVAVFGADTGATLLGRWRRGERLTEAHRQHLYQRLARRWRGHAPVTVAALLVNLLWLWPLAALADRHRSWGAALCLLAYLPLLVLCLWPMRDVAHAEKRA